MMRQFTFLRRLLYNPSKVFILCVIFASTSLIIKGGLWRLWGLHRDQSRMISEIEANKLNILKLNANLKQAKDPAYIERQARDRFDLVDEHDLVFVFSED